MTGPPRLSRPSRWPPAPTPSTGSNRGTRPGTPSTLTQDQVYLGLNHERAETTAAVQATARRVMTHAGQAILAYFFSSGNGRTEANEDVFGGSPLLYLRSVVDIDPNGRAWDADSPLSTWSTPEFSASILQGLYQESIGTLESLDFSHRTPTGRLIIVGLKGQRGQQTISAWDFVLRFNQRTPRDAGLLYSTRFAVVRNYPLIQRAAPLNLAGGQSIYFGRDRTQRAPRLPQVLQRPRRARRLRVAPHRGIQRTRPHGPVLRAGAL